MSERHVFILAHDVARRLAVETVRSAPEGWTVEVRPPKRNDPQNRLLHAALTDIADQVTWHGHKFDADDWKRMLMATFMRKKGMSPKLVPALDGKGIDIIYHHTSKLPKRDFSDLCEHVFSFGAENGVTFKEPAPARMER